MVAAAEKVDWQRMLAPDWQKALAEALARMVAKTTEVSQEVKTCAKTCAPAAPEK